MTLKKALEGDDKELVELYLQIVYQNEGLGAVTKAFEETNKYTFYELNSKVFLIKLVNFQENFWVQDPTKSLLIKPNNNDGND
jgi:hypothetical protein